MVIVRPLALCLSVAVPHPQRRVALLRRLVNHDPLVALLTKSRLAYQFVPKPVALVCLLLLLLLLIVGS